MKHVIAATWLILGIACTQPAIADPSVRDLSARTELHPIETLTLSVRQFLTGDKNGKPFTIAGELRFPQSSAARFPAVILQHGSSGSAGRDELWAKIFNEMGIASFVVDSFSGRGLTRISLNRSLFGPFDTILDAYRAFDVLSKHPRIDPTRIAIMAIFTGRLIAALYSSLKRFQRMWNPSAAFVAHIRLFAPCSTTFIGVHRRNRCTDSTVPWGATTIDHAPKFAPCRCDDVERLRLSDGMLC